MLVCWKRTGTRPLTCATHLLVAGPEGAPPLVIFHGGNAPDTIGHPGKSAEQRVSPRDNSYGRLAGFTAPTLLFAAENDLFFRADRVVPRAKQIIPNLVQTEVLRGSGHYPSREAIRFINGAIRSFIGHDTGAW